MQIQFEDELQALQFYECNICIRILMQQNNFDICMLIMYTKFNKGYSGKQNGPTDHANSASITYIEQLFHY